MRESFLTLFYTLEGGLYFPFPRAQKGPQEKLNIFPTRY